MRSENHRRFEVFGSNVALHLGDPPAHRPVGAEVSALEGEATLRLMHGQLSRFDPDSELSRLNSDPAERVAVNPMLASLLTEVVRAGELTGGLVDATQLDAIKASGYSRSRIGLAPASLADALRAAPPRRPARASSARDWSKLDLDLIGGSVRRPPSVKVDGGGIAKGLAADRLAERFADYSTFAIDCGGDLRIGGSAGFARRVEVSHPLADDEPAAVFDLVEGAVATSGLRTRVWRQGDGYAHHLIDPSTGDPAWTGVIQATATAPTGVEAEARAKAAVLAGPEHARGWLEPYGGFVIVDDGTVEAIPGSFVLASAPLQASRVA